MKVSIIINTYNRKEPLEAVLEDLCDQEYPEYEIVVVVGPSTDGSQNMLEALSHSIKLLHCPVPNLCVSRNMGLAAASGDIALFIDDDAIPQDKNWIQRYVDAFSDPKFSNAAIIGSSVKNLYSEYFEFFRGYSSRYGFQTFANETAIEDPTETKPPKGWFERVIGCNNAMHLGKIRSIGGFDENYAYYADETDLCVRALDAGYDVININGNHVRHFKQKSGIRKSKHDIRWDIIARSDTYYCLKNSKDLNIVRGIKTFVFAWKKHYIKEVFSVWSEDSLSFFIKLKINCRLFLGLFQGFLLALSDRKLFNFDNTESNGKIDFLAYDTERVRKQISNQQVLAGIDIRMCRYFWENRPYPDFELFQVYHNSDGSGWSEKKAHYSLYKRNTLNSFELEIPVSGKQIELRIDPARTLGKVFIGKLSYRIDNGEKTVDILKNFRFEDLEEEETIGTQGRSFKVVTEDPRLFPEAISDVSEHITFSVGIEFRDQK